MSRKSKVYPLDIHIWEGTYAWTKGHHTIAAFESALDDQHDIRLAGSMPRHSWARYSREGDEGCLSMTPGPGRGVFPITEVEW